MSSEIVVGLTSGFIGSVLGGAIAAYGAILSVRNTEKFRRTEKLKSLLFANFDLLQKCAHPSDIVENESIDNAIIDLIPFLPYWKRKNFCKTWGVYRYEQKRHANTRTIPLEYTEKNTTEVKKVIESRLHDILALLE